MAWTEEETREQLNEAFKRAQSRSDAEARPTPNDHAKADSAPKSEAPPDYEAAERALEDDPERLTALQYGRAMSLALKDWGRDEFITMIRKMNRDHAVVVVGNSVRYLYEAPGADGQSELKYLKAEDMKVLYEATPTKVTRLVPNAVGKAKKKDGKPLGEGDFDAVLTDVSPFEEWRGNPDRPQYTGIGLYPPGTSEPNGHLNLWRGFTVDPKPGDWSRFSQHIHTIVCGDNAEIFTWLMDWLADIFQNPGDKPGTAIVLKSAVKGTGKSILIDMLRRILGVHATVVDKPDQVVGRFNTHLLRALLLGVEEAIWAGDKKSAGTLKNLITAPTLTFEPKGVDAFTAPNYTRLLFTSNEDWAVPVGIDERRFLVLEVDNPRAKDPDYFKPIYKQMQEGGLRAMLHELLHRKITSDLRNPPETAALKEQRKQSLSDVNRWVWTLAKDGEFRDPADKSRVITLERYEPTEVPTAMLIAAAKAACGHYEGRSVDTNLGALLTKLGVGKSREGGGERQRTRVFPPLEDFRGNVEKVLKVPCGDDAENAPVVENVIKPNGPFTATLRGAKTRDEVQAHRAKLDRVWGDITKLRAAAGATA